MRHRASPEFAGYDPAGDLVADRHAKAKTNLLIDLTLHHAPRDSVLKLFEEPFNSLHSIIAIFRHPATPVLPWSWSSFRIHRPTFPTDAGPSAAAATSRVLRRASALVLDQR